MSSDYRKIGKEILNELEFDSTRLGEALSTLNSVVRDCLERSAWDEVFTHCESAYELCDEMHGLEWSNVNTAHAEGIFHAYKGVSHLYQAEEAKQNEDVYEESKELAKAIYCLEKSQQSFHFDYRDQWDESIICLSLGRLYRGQNKLNEALLAFQRILGGILDFTWLSIKRGQEITKVVSAETEKTRRLFGDQKSLAPSELGEFPSPMQRKVIPFRLPILNEIAAGKEKPASDDIIGYMRRTDEFEFEFEGQTLKAELLRGSRLTFLPEYDYVAMLVSGGSMDQVGISPNDYVILQRPNRVPVSPTHRDIVAVVFRGENDNRATLKRIHIESNRVTLEPESLNSEHKPRILQPEFFAGDNPPVKVVGIAIAVLKPQRQNG